MTQYKFADPGTLKSINELPDPFIRADGSRVADPAEWPEQREYLKQMLTHYFYGTQPPFNHDTVGTLDEFRIVFDGQAIEEKVTISFGCGQRYQLPVRIVRPNLPGAFPVVTYNWTDGQPFPAIRESVTERHYVMAGFDKVDMAPDSLAFYEAPLYKENPGYTWGAIALWSWGHRLLADYLVQQNYCNPAQLVATGHSRGGKIALCAAIYDERFAVAVPNCSGCGGSGCLRYLGSRMGENTGFVETVGLMTAAFPYWYSPLFAGFGQKQRAEGDGNIYVYALKHPEIPRLYREMYLPFDLHTAKALVAPRGLLSNEGLSDDWANPYGTQVTWRAADEVYQFLGAYGLNALHFRTGPHDYNNYDVAAMLDFCDALFFGKPFSQELIRIPPPGEREVGFCDDPVDSLEADFVREHSDIRYCKFHFGWSKPDVG